MGHCDFPRRWTDICWSVPYALVIEMNKERENTKLEKLHVKDLEGDSQDKADKIKSEQHSHVQMENCERSEDSNPAEETKNEKLHEKELEGNSQDKAGKVKSKQHNHVQIEKRERNEESNPAEETKNKVSLTQFRK